MSAAGTPVSVAHRMIRHILTHPAIIPLKGRMRSAWWGVKAAGFVNPSLRKQPASLLFVCLGNICRSPFAAERAAQILASTGSAHIRCASAGIHPSQAERCPDEACAASAAYGIRLEGHRPQPLSRELMASHDLIVVMEVAQFQRLGVEYPEFRDRIYLLSLFDERPANTFERYHIPDPFAQPRDVFDECYRRIDRALDRLIAQAVSR